MLLVAPIMPLIPVAIQLNVVAGTPEVNPILVELPEQIVSVKGVAITLGVGLIITGNAVEIIPSPHILVA